MPSLRILIVEDEILIARDLKEQLKSFGYHIVSIAKNSQVAIAAFNNMQPDLVIMDIILEKSEFDGIELAKIFNNLKPVPIIYLTGAHTKKLQERAKLTRPANYLIKPCNEEQLRASIELAIHNFFGTERINVEGEDKLTFFEAKKLYSTRNTVFIRQKELFIKVSIENLLWVKADNSYVKLSTEKDSLLLSTGLKSFLEQFPHPDLHRVHRSYAANLSKVIAFDGGNIYIQRQNQSCRIPVGPQYRENIFRNFYKLKTKP